MRRNRTPSKVAKAQAQLQYPLEVYHNPTNVSAEERVNGQARIKLRKHFEDRQVKLRKQVTPASTKIFSGVYVYFTGYLGPNVRDYDLKHALSENGGTVRSFYSKEAVTHIVCTQLAQNKMHKLHGDFAQGKQLYIVSPQWILDSLKNGVRQSEGKYAISSLNKPESSIKSFLSCFVLAFLYLLVSLIQILRLAIRYISHQASILAILYRMVNAAFWIAGIFAIAALVISLHGIWGQWKCYKRPEVQRCIVRIMLMPLIYAVTSWISFGSHEASIFLDPIRDCYEAFVLWVFFNLMMSYLDGEVALLMKLDDGRLPTPHPFPFNLILNPVDFSILGNFILLKRGILQFVIVKPIHVVIVIVLRLNGVYEEGLIAADNGYIYLALLYNLSVMLSMYSLVMFYMSARPDLEPFRPWPKFLCIKAVLFFSFWQSVVISIMVKLDVISNGSASQIQHWIICLEMMIAAVAHQSAFSTAEFSSLPKSACRLPLKFAIRDSFGTKDLSVEFRHTVHGTDFRRYNDLFDANSQRRPLLHANEERYISADPDVSFLQSENDPMDEWLYEEAKAFGTDYNYNVVSDD
ncbi:hypothetical protein MIR68_008827 [Amoeboaphelidium protococcarum]|nr:hypothetical protein MIR68_008827 [Amoeboaphelidium protococcarum]